MFGSVGERDECLRMSFNLAKGITLDKYMPKRYEEQYRVFKDIAYKLRTSMDVNTFIGFQGHDLVLKQKQKNQNGEKFGWVIYDKWTPKVTDQIVGVKKAARGGTNNNSSKQIDLNAMKRLVFVSISGSSGETQGADLEAKLKADLMGQEDSLLIEKVTINKKGSAVLHFLDEKTIKAFIQKYSGKDFLGGKVKLSQG